MTFLFTDVEGSTRRWEADAQAMRAALAAHDEVLRNAVSSHGGFLFKHTGDGVCAAFSSPTSAVEAAVAAQRELELPVRMGIATGEAEFRDSDYFGTVLNRAARLMSAGHGGQILVADSAVRLLSGVDLADLGAHRLRDVPEPITVFQVRAPGLGSEFPPLRTVDGSRGNIRAPTSAFIGREAELQKVARAVHGSRLVTLTGVGGVGKTRLAVEVARQLSAEFPDGIWLVELTAVSQPDAVPDAVAAVLGITQQPGLTVAESVAQAVEGKVALLVVDNCEHLRDAAAETIDTILARSVAVRVLATSREGLGLDDEHLRAVPSLDVGDGSGSAAVDLFIDRARTVVADFELTHPDERAAAVEICVRLDGIPLAIELAASRMASMSVSEVRDRLDQRFRLLVGSRRGLERHQTLRHTVAWSFDLLAQPERDLLQRCSVFAGGFDLAGAVAVAPAERDEFEVLDLLDALVRKSLLTATRKSGRTRYTMLETIRQFAEEQLVDAGMAAAVRTAHAAHFAGREADVEALWDSPRQIEAYDWFATELPNLRAAFRWAADESHLDIAATIAAYASFLGYATENLEPLGWAEEVIPEAAAADHPRLATLNTLASQCWMVGRTDESIRYADAALSAIKSRGYRDTRFGSGAGLLGAGYLASGNPQRSVDCYRACLLTELTPIGVALHTSGLAMALTGLGDFEAAFSAAKIPMGMAEVTRNPYVEATALFGYSIALALDESRTALDAVNRALQIATQTGNRILETNLTSMSARLMAYSGEPVEALDALVRGIPRLVDVGNQSVLRNTLAILAGVFDRFGRPAAATRLLGFAINAFVSASIPEIQATIEHARQSLGDERFEELRRTGASMTTAAVVEFAETEIADLRAEITPA